MDNVSIELFFSILKSECIYLKENLQKQKINEVVKKQEKIQELAPMQFRKQALASLVF